MRIHFMGIGGSGISSAAELAIHLGHKVTGCVPANSHSSYLEALKRDKVKIYAKHDKKHLKGVDILAVSPFAYFQNQDEEELKYAKEVMTWQSLVGNILLKDKHLIAISGTHGKSTTAALAALLFSKNKNLFGGAIVGAVLKEWNSNFKGGNGREYIVESDEFYDNFLNYHPETIVLNNIEYDHPDFFKSEEEMFASFRKHISTLVGAKNLIVNTGSPGIAKLLKSVDLKNINLIGYSTGKKLFEVGKLYKLSSKQFETTRTDFSITVDGKNISTKFTLQVPGEHNISNALGVIALADLYGFPLGEIADSLKNFEGIGRRSDLIGKARGVPLFDDYAHHPTAIKATIEGIIQKYPNEKILVIIEPHTFSRTKALLEGYTDCCKKADQTIVLPIFRSRDTETFGISNQTIADKIGKNAIALDFDETRDWILKNAKEFGAILVMGAGDSHDFAESLLGKNEIN